jgi:hypothetical protein
MGPTEYHDIAAQTITERPPVSLLEPNQAFLIVGLYRGCWICEAHVGQFLWKQGLQDEYSVLLSPVLQ